MSMDDVKYCGSVDWAGVDATKVDDEFSRAAENGSLVVASESSPGEYAIRQVVKTGQGASTIGLDTATRRVFLTTAEYGSPLQV
jgi:hypothetical protein